MSSGIGNFYQNALLDLLLGDGHDGAFPNPVYAALFTVAPSDSSAGVEVTGGSYARASVSNDTAHFDHDVPGNPLIINQTTITFPTPTASWGTVVAVGLMSASTGGNLFLWAEIDPGLVVPAGFAAKIDPYRLQLAVQ